MALMIFWNWQPVFTFTNQNNFFSKDFRKSEFFLTFPKIYLKFFVGLSSPVLFRNDSDSTALLYTSLWMLLPQFDASDA